MIEIGHIEMNEVDSDLIIRPPHCHCKMDQPDQHPHYGYLVGIALVVL